MKKIYFLLFLIFFVWGHGLSQPLSGTYTIGITSADYTSFNAAVTDLITKGVGGPVVFSVAPGTYTEQVTIPHLNNVSAINTITFQSATGDSTDVILTFSSTDENNNYTLKFDSAFYVIFKGITLQATGTNYARIVYLARGASHISFINNRFVGKPGLSELVFANIATYGDPSSTDITFLNNRFENGKRSISLSGVYNDYISHTLADHNDFINPSEHAIHIEYSQYSLIRNNRIESNLPITGVHIQGLTRGDTLAKNIILLQAGGLGIHLYSTGQVNDTTVISNNFIYLNTTVADHAIDIYSTKAPVKILYNTVHITGKNKYSYCLYSNGNGTKSYRMVMNNILANDAEGMAFYYYYTPDRSDYNNLWSTGQYTLNYYNGSGFDLDYWRTNFHHDLHSITVNPYFISGDSWQVQNPALNAAAFPLADVTTDIDGKSRDINHPDIGAWEFTPSPVPLNGSYTIGGTSADYDSIKDAVKELEVNGISGAVIFNIASGTYPEQVIIPEINGTSDTHTVTFRSASGDSTDVTISFTPVYDNKVFTVLLDGADHIIFTGLTLSTNATTGFPVLLEHGACFNEISHSRITVPINNTNHLIQLGSESLSYTDKDTNNVFTSCYFENGSYAVNTGKTGTSNAPVVSANTQIKNNILKNCRIRFSNGKNPIISGNSVDLTVNSTYTSAIEVRNNAQVLNNFILMNNTAGLDYATGIYGYGENNTIVFNTIKIVGQGMPLVIKGHSEILNNILTTGGGSAVDYEDTTGCHIDHNIYYTSDEAHCISVYAGYSQKRSFSWWHQNSGFDQHSLFHDPVFVSGTDLHTFDPWLNDRGVSVSGIITDIDGDARDASTPDIGADEFTGVSPLKGIYTIGATGDFKNFTEVADTLKFCGVEDSAVFHVQTGMYEEHFILRNSEITRLPDTASILFRAITPDSANVLLRYNATNSTDNYIVILDSMDHVTFEGITFKPLNTQYSSALWLLNGVSDIRINNNTFVGIQNNGILIYSQHFQDHNNRITGNRFYNGNLAISLNGTDDTHKGSGFVIKNNNFFSQHQYPIYLMYQQDADILNNRILHTEMIDFTYSGIYLKNSTSVLVANNAISFLAGQQSGGIGLDGTSQTRIFYNSIQITGSTNESRCFNQQNGGENNILKNNILVNKSGGVVIYAPEVTTLTSDHNNLYSNSDRFIYTDRWVTDLADWRSAYGKDQHSFSVDPLFFSPDSLYTTVPQLNGTATPVTEVTTDITGATRDATHPDMGVYEFDGIYTLGNDTTICNNTSITLDAGAGYDSYLWNTGATTQTIETTPENDGESWYKVTVTVGETDYNDSLKVTSTGPSVSLGPDTAICEGTSLILDAGTGDYSYLWSDNSTGQTLGVTSAGNYSVTVTDVNGCQSQDTVTVTVNTPVKVTLTYANDQLQADYQNGSQYTWYLNNNVISIGTDYIITPATSGDYFVEVVDENGCTTVSDTLHVSLTGIPGTTLNGLAIYPNPSKGKITLLFDKPVNNLQVDVFDLLGNKVCETTPENPANTQTIMDLQELPAGIYFLKIRTDGNIITQKIVIRH